MDDTPEVAAANVLIDWVIDHEDPERGRWLDTLNSLRSSIQIEQEATP